MCKLLIVDDEYMVIESISRVVTKYVPNVNIVGSAESGRQAIEVADELNPDIIFMDIEMSGLNGFEAIKEIKKRHQCYFVIISAYDYFSYAKEAITQGVVDYILKPFDKEQIIEVLKRVISNIENDKSKRNDELVVRENLRNTMSLLQMEVINRFIFYNKGEEEEIKKYIKLFDMDFSSAYCFIISPSEKIPQNILSRLQGTVMNSMKCITGFITDSNIVTFVPVGRHDIAYKDAEVLSAMRKLCDVIKKNYGVDVLIGIGSIYSGFQGINKSFKEALEVIRTAKRNRGVIQFKELRKGDLGSYSGITELLMKMSEIEKLLISRIRLGDLDESIKAFDNICAQVTSYSKMDFNDIKNRLLEVVVNIYKTAAEENIKSDEDRLNYDNYIDKYLSIKNKNQLVNWIKDTIVYICDIKSSEENRTQSFAEMAKNYIKENYNREISQEELAKKLHISSSYLSKIFKEVIGENFVDYITRIRIEKSLEILRTTNLSIKQISYKLGYSDPNYFCKVFKKVTGLKPTEVRTQANAREGRGKNEKANELD